MNENTFKYKNMEFIAIEIPEDEYMMLDKDCCEGCYFLYNCDDAYAGGVLPHCMSGNRNDGRNVIFKLV